jgi:hypothetical protein
VFSVLVFRFRKFFILARQLIVSQAPTAPGRKPLQILVADVLSFNISPKLKISVHAHVLRVCA